MGVQLTRFSDLGLRVLMYLTQRAGPSPVTNAEIASQFRVPHNHLVKVVHKLGRLGWVETQRGRNGGLRLGVDPTLLRLGRVVRALEGTTQLVDCQDPPCVLRQHCLLKGVLDAGLESFYEELDRHTLAAICESGTGAALLTLRRKYDAARA